MLIKDRVYGNFQINEPVILELLKSKLVLRLKGISQFGVPDKYHYIKGFSRYEHSVGVMILLRILGASLEEQVAGLLHDVSHTAFSHIVDWVIGQGKTENFQDDRHLEILITTEISGILKKYGYKSERLADLHSYTLLDRDIPDLCADRIDYCLRELTRGEGQSFKEKFIVKDGKIIMKDSRSAIDFAETFLSHQIKHWAGFEESCRYEIFSEVLKRAVELKIITLADFYGDEEPILKKIEESDDPVIKKGLEVLRKKLMSGLPFGKNRVHKKFRYVDPEFEENGNLVRVTKAFPDFIEKLEAAREVNKEGMQSVDWR